MNIFEIFIGRQTEGIENGVYYFFLTDHLGNNRVVAKADGTVIQKNHYYPFGMTFAESTNEKAQPYKYNGKEYDSMHGLNWYDSDARPYDAVIPRTPTPDPHAENYYAWSPYAYCGNNPLRFIDPTGMYIEDPGNERDNKQKNDAVNRTEGLITGVFKGGTGIGLVYIYFASEKREDGEILLLLSLSTILSYD